MAGVEGGAPHPRTPMASRGNHHQEDGEEEEPAFDLISTLPRDNRWTSLCRYRGFWLLDLWLQGTLAMRRRLVTRPDDIFIASSPKCGATWLKALVFSLVHRRRHNPTHPCHPLRTASPQECVQCLEDVFSVDPDPDLDALPSPRIWSVHTPYSALPTSVHDSGCRIVYVVRDPKDVFVSLFHFIDAVDSSARAVTMDEAFEMFCSGICTYGPMWEHAVEYWNESLSRPGKVLFLHYEEMKEDPVGALRRLAEFLGCPFSEEEEREGVVGEISELCGFRSLTGLAVNNEGEIKMVKRIPFPRKSYFRRGEVGDWRNHLSPEQAGRLDMITEAKLRGTGLKLS